MTVVEIIQRLEVQYGEMKRRYEDPISELVYTIISQNTSDTNSIPAFEALKKAFPNWRKAAEANPEVIATTIRSAGLENIKAERIKLVLNEILSQRGNLNLEFLHTLPLNEAKAWLKKLPGVGPKTAACVLLFSLGMPALPIDTHVYRVSHRLGLLSAKISPENAHDVLEGMVPASYILRFHLLLVQHGRRQCKARRPGCSSCPLLEGCPFGQTLVYGTKLD